jgi:asparagine synthetase B (glutamine-hydrolysing)
MAGITGIICKKNAIEQKELHEAMDSMMQKLAYSESQGRHSFSDGTCFAGNVVPVGSEENNHYIKYLDLPYHFFIDGLVFVNEKEKASIKDEYPRIAAKNDYEFLPFLFDCYGKDFVSHITGWFNIFVYNEQTSEHLLVNDRLGFLPIYYYDCDSYFLFASKIESLLASGLMKDIEFDAVTMAEHLFFNYPLSDHTYIKDIYTLPDASALVHNNSALFIRRYWNVEEFFDHTALNKKQSIEAINQGLKLSIDKLFKNTNGEINFSLTGGWDSRVVLSYLLPEYKERINTYSFGAPEAEDIWVPEFIAEKEGFSYTPYKLDHNYLNNEFLENAEDTVILSNGTRNYKRTHYVYAVKQIAKNSDTLLTGIFGDEVFKVGKPQGGSVISNNAVNFIESGFNIDSMIKQFKKSNIPGLFNIPKEELTTKLTKRLSDIKKRFGKYRTSGQQYFAFRFTLNLRKYFGHEANSYNDFVYCHSPFIDYDFLKEFARTKYMVSKYPFKKSSLKLKAQSSWLYYKLTKLNQKRLTKYPSSRAFNMKDTNTIIGLFKILNSKILKKKYRKKVDGFNTKDTDGHFHQSLLNNISFNNYQVFNTPDKNPELNNIEDYYSLLYWTSVVQSKYL